MKQLDRFGELPRLYVDKEESFKTYCGSVTTIGMNVMMLAVGVAYGIPVFNSETLSLRSDQSILDHKEEFNPSHYGFEMNFSLPRVTDLDPKFASWHVEYVTKKSG